MYTKPMASIKDGSYALLRIPSSRIAKYIYAYRHMNGYFWRVLPSSSHSSHEHAHPSTCILHLFYTLPRLAACTLSGPHMHMHILPIRILLRTYTAHKHIYYCVRILHIHKNDCVRPILRFTNRPPQHPRRSVLPQGQVSHSGQDG